MDALGRRRFLTRAVLGTTASLGLIALLAAAFVAASHFTGLADEEATYLKIFSGQIDLAGLLLGGIVIGSLGVLDDVTITPARATIRYSILEVPLPPGAAVENTTWGIQLAAGDGEASDEESDDEDSSGRKLIGLERARRGR